MSRVNSSSKGNIPFSWENKPGIRKLVDSSSNREEVIKLACDQDSNNIAFKPPSRSSSKKGTIITKSVNDVTEGREKSSGTGEGRYSNENTFQPPFRSSFSKRTVIGKVNDAAVKGREDDSTGEAGTIKLRPPPCDHDLVIPLPPCANFQPAAALRSSSSRKGMIIMRKLEDDPFLMAYKECTKSTKKSTSSSFMKKSSFLGSSCKQSCSVRDDSIVRVSQVPLSNSQRRRPVTYDI